jgi:hypothetical protein
MQLDTPTFVVQRRVNQPLSAVQRGLADRSLLAPTCVLDLEAAGLMYLAEPLRPVAPFSSRQPTPTWCAEGQLLTTRRHAVASIEIEVSMWSDAATCVTLRPAARHPERWPARRVRRYFTAAHAAADETARLLARRAESTLDAYADRAAEADDHGAVPVGIRS